MKTRSHIMRTAAALLGLAGSVQAGPVELAAELLAASGISNGIACVDGCGDGALAVALAQQSRLLVLAQDERTGMVALAQHAADAARMLNTTVTVQRTRAGIIPLGDNYVDLLVRAEQADGTVSNISVSEITRALCPRGRAVIGGGTATIVGLSNWLAQSVQSNLTAYTTNTAFGAWAVLTKGLLPGADDWSMWFHGPDNNPVSADTVLKFPYLSQWYGEPYHGPQPVSSVAAGGRFYSFAGRNYKLNNYVSEADTHWLRAFNHYNGTLLWQRKLPANFHVHRPVYYATTDGLYLAESNTVLFLDGASGALRETIVCSGMPPGTQGKWIAVYSNLLFMMAGPTDASMPRYDRYDCGGSYGTNEAPWFSGAYLAAYNLAGRTTQWSRVEACDIDTRNIGILAGQLYFNAVGPPAAQGSDPNRPWTNVTSQARVACLDAATGALLWEQRGIETLDYVNRFSFSYGHPLRRSNCGMLLASNVLTLFRKGRTNMVALAASTGAQLWSQPVKGAGSLGMAFALGGELYVSGLRVDSTGNPSVLDPLTGAKKRYWQCNTGITCARVTVSPDAFYGGSGRGFNRNTSQSTEEMNLKSGCEEGTFVANGLLSGTPTSCGCNVLARGFSVFGPAGALNFDPPVNAVERLEYGADPFATAPFATDANDWPAHRANNQRSAATAVPVPTASIVQLWQYQPAARLKLSTPVAAGGRVFFGANDGAVRCLAAQNGALQWTFYTTGRIFAAPTIWSNRVYAASADGYAYCLEAASGRLLWRFRAAPYERRIRIYGELLSTWPVHASIVIEDGIAYCAAGMVDLDGTHVYALDAQTGGLLWHNGTSGGLPALGSDHKGMIAAGHLTVLRSNLWMASGNAGSPAAYALNNGTFATAPRLRQATGLRGTELGVYGNTYLMYGGLVRWRPHDERRTLRDIDVALQEVSATGQRLQPEITLGTNGYAIPAWDARHTLVVTKGFGSTYRENMLLECWDTPLTTSGVTQTRLANLTYQPPYSAWRLNIGTVNDTTPLSGYVHPKLWGISGTQKETYACALAPNAALATLGNNYSPLATTWTLRAMQRDTGATIWEQTLPTEPLTDGLCVTRDGAMIVAFTDGRVGAYGVVPEPAAILVTVLGTLAARRICH